MNNRLSAEPLVGLKLNVSMEQNNATMLSAEPLVGLKHILYADYH